MCQTVLFWNSFVGLYSLTVFLGTCDVNIPVTFGGRLFSLCSRADFSYVMALLDWYVIELLSRACRLPPVTVLFSRLAVSTSASEVVPPFGTERWRWKTRECMLCYCLEFLLGCGAF